VGLIGGVEIVADKSTKALFPAEVKSAVQVSGKALNHGLIVRPLPSDTLGICPPLIITQAQIDELFDRLQGALDDVLGGLQSAA
jgi:4-aminobutyrate--pyruvate transaminase